LDTADITEVEVMITLLSRAWLGHFIVRVNRSKTDAGSADYGNMAEISLRVVYDWFVT
jgi:hypothetical protein